MKKLFIFIFLLSANFSMATTYYVATNGNDNNLGTATNIPFLTISKAASKAVAGDIIYIRGGRYFITAKINLSKNGTAANRITLMGYPGDTRPIIDGSSMAVSTANRGIELGGNYWTIKGLDIYKAGDNGMHISGGNNIVEQCNFYENRDTGCQLANGAHDNKIVNCDSYFNRDSTSATVKDGNADGFAAKLDVGTGNSFKGCRAWQNSDDGWDGLLTTGSGLNPSTTYDSCWCFMNGYLKSGVASTGNGNGFKMGGNNETHDATLTFCLSAYNRVKGFDQNNNNGSMILYNCTGYKNKPNFGMNNNAVNAGKVMIVKNCVSLSSGATDVFNSGCVRTNNSWQAPVTTNTADFLSVDSIGLRNPRKADGSLPDINFMHLVQGSDLIDAGTNVGLTFNGSSPDIGCFESNYPLPLKFVSYSLNKKENSIVNIWSTVNEINVAYFNIQKSIDGKDFINIGKIIAKNKIKNEYLFSDGTTNQYLFSNNIYYRIEAVDNNGSVTYSTVQQITKQVKSNINVYPNPIKDKFIVEGNGVKEISIVDNLGKVVKTIKTSSANQYIDTKELASGTYLLKITLENSSVELRKIVKD